MIARCIPGFIVFLTFVWLVIADHPGWATAPFILSVPLLWMPVSAYCKASK